jgi:hypothetical protein
MEEIEQDGWIPGEVLFEIDEAISRGTIVMNLLSDAAQRPAIKLQLTNGKVCYINEDARPCTNIYRHSTFLTDSLPFLRTSRRFICQCAHTECLKVASSRADAIRRVNSAVI